MSSRVKDGLIVAGMLGFAIACIITCWVCTYTTNHKADLDLPDFSYNWIDNIEIHYQAKILDGKGKDIHVTRQRDLRFVSSSFNTKELKSTNQMIDSMVVNMINERKAEIDKYTKIEEERRKRAEVEKENKARNDLKAKGCIEKTVGGKVFISCPVS